MNARAQALHDAADAIEHGCEFNEDRTLRWTPKERADNNRRITESRELRARADAAEREV